ncbi:MAG TPA: hypothetical protein VN222_06345, partial [Novosphingobium sp.]|nr:hypothetical protein [Novosphingobium sp.]
MATMKPEGALSFVAGHVRNGAARLRWPTGRARWAAFAVLGLMLAGGAALAWRWPGVHGDAVAGASFGARIGCSCRYVEGRPLDQCAHDFEAGMSLISLSEDSAARSVT